MNKKHMLTVAGLAAFLCCSGSAWAVNNITSTETVNSTNNSSTLEGNHYSSIVVNNNNGESSAIAVDAAGSYNNLTNVYATNGSVIRATGSLSSSSVTGIKNNINLYVDPTINGLGTVTIEAIASGQENDVNQGAPKSIYSNGVAGTGQSSSTWLTVYGNAVVNASIKGSYLGTAKIFGLQSNTIIEGNAIIDAEISQNEGENLNYNSSLTTYGANGLQRIGQIKGNATINSSTTGPSLNGNTHYFAEGVQDQNIGMNAIISAKAVRNDFSSIIDSNVAKTAQELAVGIGGNVNVGGDTTVNVSAIDYNKSAILSNSTDDNTTMAWAIASPSGAKNNKLGGNVLITAEAKVSTLGKRFAVYSLYSVYNGNNDLTSTNKIKQIQGDVYANYGGANNIVLDTASSYLQGNLLSNAGDAVFTNTINVSNGATWRPVYDNRYGTWFNYGNANTYATTYTTTSIKANSFNEITLKGNGVIDLTWDGWSNGKYTPLTGRSEGYRNLTLGKVSGTNGIFRIDTDIAKGVGDTITLNKGDSGSIYKVQVNYDPFFDAKSKVGDTLNAVNEGVKVVDGAGALISKGVLVEGIESEYKAYQYLPTIQWNASGQYWEIISLSNTGTSIVTPSTNLMTAADSRLVRDEIFLADGNMLDKRFEELRVTKPEGEIWARYGNGDLRNGHGRKATLDYNAFQVGYDKGSSNRTGDITYRGGVVTHTQGDSAYETGSGDDRYTSVALYQTGLGMNNSFYNVALSYGRIGSKYDTTDLSDTFSKADYHSQAWSVRGEYGRRFTKDNLYITPVVGILAGSIGSANYVTSSDMAVHVDRSQHIISKIGFNVGKVFHEGDVYAKANYYHDFGSRGGVQSDEVTYERDGFKNYVVLGVGGAVKINDDVRVYGEVNKYLGDLKSSYGYNVGVRYSF